MTSPPNQLVHALSFDIEDWFHIVEVKALDDPSKWAELSARSSLVDRYTDLILRICDDASVKATFFILGWIAERHPALVRRIADAGHEIGTHSYWHRRVYELDPAEFRRDLRLSIDAIHAAAPTAQVRGFRAPSFSITPGTEWAFDALLDEGLIYDASLFPARRGHGGYVCRPGPHTLPTPSGRSILELPMSVAPIGFGPFHKKMCYSGGGYFRVLPPRFISQGIRLETAAGRSTVIYLHPRDFAPDCPRVPMPLERRFKCFVGLRSTEPKLRRILSEFRWGPCIDALRPATPL